MAANSNSSAPVCLFIANSISNSISFFFNFSHSFLSMPYRSDITLYISVSVISSYCGKDLFISALAYFSASFLYSAITLVSYGNIFISDRTISYTSSGYNTGRTISVSNKSKETIRHSSDAIAFFMFSSAGFHTVFFCIK